MGWETHLVRIRDNGRLTMGRVSIWKNELRVFECVSLEPSWILNQPYVSCVPCDTYPLVKRVSGKFGAHFHIKGVPNRTFVLIHTLNYFKQSEGCVGVGGRFKYLDKDNEIDTTSSRDTLNKMLEILPDESEIVITNHDNMQRFYH